MLSAILVSEVTTAVQTDRCVIIDGDSNKVDDFVSAHQGFSTAEVPPVTNSYQAEIYYPHTLLADLSAGFLADRISSGRYDYTEPLARCPPVEQRHSDEWGQAFSNLQRGETPPYTRLGVETMRGNTARDRTTIWFAGLMGRSPESRMSTPSLGAVGTYLRDEGYDSLAARLEAL